MRSTSWNTGWQFSDGKFRRPFDSTPIPTITLPHDAAIYTDTYAEAPGHCATGFYGGGMAVYTKYFDAPAEWQGQQVKLAFDGAFQNAEVVVNGHLSTIHHYGYTPFTADLTPYLYFHRQNRVRVTVNNTAQPNSRWYTGTGLYRPVSLLVGPAVHIAPWGIFAHTQRIEDGTAYVMAEVTVVNDTTSDVDTRANVTLAPESGAVLADAFQMVHVPANSSAVARVYLVVPNAPIWDIDDPRLCTVTATVGEDEAVTSFGIRSISVDPVNGFQLNGRSIKLKGGCVHHDNGTLGSAAFADSEYRKMKLHKDNGYNAIRTAHNPPSTAMLDACDRLGLLVMDEAFDVWRIGKVTNDYHLRFETDWQKDMTAYITRDRNHPCVVLWSTGNEIGERGGLSGGFEIARQLADFVRSLDPTRPVTNALCSFFSGLDDEKVEQQRAEARALIEGGAQNTVTRSDRASWGTMTEPFAAPLDVVGYNYFEERYDPDSAQFPQRVICGTESYPMHIDQIWDIVERRPNVIGDFTWTSYDYLGEAGIGRAAFVEPDSNTLRPDALSFGNQFPWRTANDADFDICGFDRPQLHYRSIVWGSDETYAVVHDPAGNGMKEIVSRWGWPLVDAHWNWADFEGEPVRVDVYSAAEEVELSLNGAVIGRAPAGKTERYTARFELPYAPGTLTAVSYTNGAEVSRCELATTGAPAALKLSTEPGCFCAGEQSLAFVTVEVVDAAGVRVPTVAIRANAAVTGAATLQAFASARPDTAENYTTGVFTSYEGRWQAVLRSGAEPGAATLRVEAEGFAPAELSINVQ